MKKDFRNTTLSVTLVAGIASAVWMPASHACSPDPYLASVCAMAMPNYTSGFNEYVLAAGQELAINSNTALFALIGTTYGGNGQTTFKLPDLRGRVIVGAGAAPGLAPISPGTMGGSSSTQLTSANLPAHNHSLSTAAQVNTSGLKVTTTLTGLTGTLSGIAQLKGSTGGTLTKDPTNATLGTPTTLTNIYSSAAPTIAMQNGSIDTSGLTVSINGQPTSTLSGSATLSGATDMAGMGTAFSTMPPYLGMYYYIATTGIFPSRN